MTRRGGSPVFKYIIILVLLSLGLFVVAPNVIYIGMLPSEDRVVYHDFDNIAPDYAIRAGWYGISPVYDYLDAGESFVFTDASDYTKWYVMLIISIDENKPTVEGFVAEFACGDVVYDSASLHEEMQAYGKIKYVATFDEISDIPTGLGSYRVTLNHPWYMDEAFTQHVIDAESYLFGLNNQRSADISSKPVISDLPDITVPAETAVLCEFTYQTTDASAHYVVQQGFVDSDVKGICVADGRVHKVAYTYYTIYETENTVRFKVTYDSGRYTLADDVVITTIAPSTTNTGTTTVTITVTASSTEDPSPRDDYTMIIIVAVVAAVIIVVIARARGGKR